jgi:asparagine synthase (glutamine-hydrolysing)
VATQARRLRLPRIIRAVKKQGLTYLTDANLQDLYDRARELDRAGVPGVFLEAGCAAGGSALVLATAKAKTRPLYLYDVFGMIPPPSEHDGQDVHERYDLIQSGQSPGIKGQRYYGYETDLLGKVKASFTRLGVPPEEHQVHFIQGRYEDTMRIDQSVALAHIDCDWYASVLTCLRQITPHLVRGGVLIIDDYSLGAARGKCDGYSGCQAAVDEYFADKRTEFDFIFRSRVHIIRK